jgi:hypothetical protein
MLVNFKNIARHTLTAFAVLFLAACAAPANYTGGNSEIRVLVMGEDSDPHSIARNDDAFKRVLAAMKESMLDHDFRMVDEEFIAAELGWRITNRRSKRELVEAMKLANASGKAHLSSRAMALFRIQTSKRDVGFAKQVSVRVDGEIYDGLTNQFLGSFEIPRASYSAPANCNKVCMTEIVGDHAREIATSIGNDLGARLAYLQNRSESSADYSNSPGIMTTYTLAFRRFTTSEIHHILHVMSSKKFPGYKSHNLLKKEAAVVNYDYVTTAQAAKIDNWLNILLSDMELHPDRIVLVSLDGTEFRLEKIISSNGAPVSPRVRQGRFN